MLRLPSIDTVADSYYRKYVRPRWFALSQDNPEIAHELAMEYLRRLQARPLLCHALTRLLEVRNLSAGSHCMGLWFANPVGLAAGFDKGCEALAALAALGFGFLEGGSITVLPQQGNPPPRLWRDAARQELWNRMGFNNPGMVAVAQNLKALREKYPVLPPIGLNLGKGKDTPLEQAAQDYCALLEYLYPFGDYFVLNVSSPNTLGLRSLQSDAYLLPLLLAAVGKSQELAGQRGTDAPKPIVVKFSPSITNSELNAGIQSCLTAKVRGAIFANTEPTLVTTANGQDLPCGHSGPPLFARALEMVELAARLTAGQPFTIIGCGGINSVIRAQQMLDSGAHLIQLYSALPFRGPLFARCLARQLIVRAL